MCGPTHTPLVKANSRSARAASCFMCFSQTSFIICLLGVTSKWHKPRSERGPPCVWIFPLERKKCLKKLEGAKPGERNTASGLWVNESFLGGFLGVIKHTFCPGTLRSLFTSSHRGSDEVMINMRDVWKCKSLLQHKQTKGLSRDD